VFAAGAVVDVYHNLPAPSIINQYQYKRRRGWERAFATGDEVLVTLDCSAHTVRLQSPTVNHTICMQQQHHRSHQLWVLNLNFGGCGDYEVKVIGISDLAFEMTQVAIKASLAEASLLSYRLNGLPPDDFFDLFCKESKYFSMDESLDAVLQRFTAAELGTRLNARFRQLKISYRSSTCSGLFFDQTYQLADDFGFTVREVISSVHKYYSDPFTAEQVASIRERVNNGRLLPSVFHRIARRHPRPFTFYEFSGTVTVEHMKNYLKHFNLPLDGCASSMFLRVKRHMRVHGIDYEEMQAAAQLKADCGLTLESSWSDSEVQFQCEALGLEYYDALDAARQLWALQESGTVLPELPVDYTGMQETCARMTFLDDRIFAGLECFEMLDAIVNVSADVR